MEQEPTFGELLSRHLRNRGESPQWLANRLQRNASTVSRWINGDTRPRDQETIVRIADVLGITNRAERRALFTAAGMAFPAEEESREEEEDTESADPARFLGRSLRLQLNEALLTFAEAMPDRIAERLYTRLHWYDWEVADRNFHLYPASCGDKGLVLAHRRLFISRAFGAYFTGLLERDNIYAPISEQIESPFVFGQSELAPLSIILRALEHPRGPRVVVIAAEGGMGKSTLAAKLIRCLYEQELIDVILGDSAKTERVHPVSGAIEPVESGYDSASTFYAKLRVQLGMPEPTGAATERYPSRMIRARLIGRRAVIVLDNLDTVVSGSELLGLLRALSSRDVRILVTTRNVEGLHSLTYKTMVVNLRPIATVVSCRHFLRWHVEHFQAEYADLRKLDLDKIDDMQIQALIARTGGIPLLVQIIISTIARTSWVYIDNLPHLFGAALLRFLYTERWQELGKAGAAGFLARQVLVWVARQQYRGEGVTFELLDQWAEEHNGTTDLPSALRLLNERFLIVNHDFEHGYLTVVPSLAQFLEQVEDLPD